MISSLEFLVVVLIILLIILIWVYDCYTFTYARLP